MQDLIIFGAGKIARVVYAYLKDKYSVYAFTVHKKYKNTDCIEGKPVLAFENLSESIDAKNFNMIIAVGYHDMNCLRAYAYSQAKTIGFSLINYIHESVKIPENVSIGEGNIILDHVSIQPFAKISNNNFIWSNSTIAHGVVLGDSNWIASGSTIAGDTKIHSNCFIGVNATVGHNINIGQGTFIGAGTLVTKNTADNEVYLIGPGKKYNLDSRRFVEFAEV